MLHICVVPVSLIDVFTHSTAAVLLLLTAATAATGAVT
jgi:hypothetical protein